MPSTFDPILRLELQAVGENASTWGTRTNNNLNLLAQAIDGHVSVSVGGSGDYTLTVAQASADESRYNFLTFSGVLTGARNVFIPASPKAYIIRDNTSGNYAITVKTSIGTGATTYQGGVIAMGCDGVSVYPTSEVNRVNRAGDIMTGTLSLPSGTSVSASQAMRSDEITSRVSTVASGMISAAIAAALPAGIITKWSGSIASIPATWYLCDGTNGTPDLRDKFIVGAGSTYAVGATGGAASTTSGAGGDHNHGGSTGAYTLTTADIPAHTHTGTTASGGAHTHTLPNSYIAASGGGVSFGAGGLYATYANSTTDSGGAHTHTFTTDAAGGGGGHSHSISSSGTHTHTVATLPPYYALAYIMKA